jgi:hypothetical protein
VLVKKVLAGVLAGAILLGTLSPALAVNEKRGGFLGFVAGCCFGLRTGGAYNEGKEIHWREWISLVIPLIPQIWDGIEGARGMTTADYAKQYGGTFY